MASMEIRLLEPKLNLNYIEPCWDLSFLESYPVVLTKHIAEHVTLTIQVTL